VRKARHIGDTPGGFGWAAGSGPPSMSSREVRRAAKNEPSGAAARGFTFWPASGGPSGSKSHDFEPPYRDRARAFARARPTCFLLIPSLVALAAERAKPVPRRMGHVRRGAGFARSADHAPGLRRRRDDSGPRLGVSRDPVSIRWRKVVRLFARRDAARRPDRSSTDGGR
jgi:hypothetical protein